MGFILMYDITNEESFNAVQDWWGCMKVATEQPTILFLSFHSASLLFVTTVEGLDTQRNQTIGQENHFATSPQFNAVT